MKLRHLFWLLAGLLIVGCGGNTVHVNEDTKPPPAAD